MNIRENAADFARVGGAEFNEQDETRMALESQEIKKKIEIADLVGSLRFIVRNLDDAAREATLAADAISEKNIVGGHYHCGRFAAHARAAIGAFKEIIGATECGGANG